MFGDVNISAILDSFSVSYDKRVRPNYGGTYPLLEANYVARMRVGNLLLGQAMVNLTARIYYDVTHLR